MGDVQLVLVVDDDAAIQNVVEESLTDGGFEPTVAGSGEEALALLKANKYRVLIIDIAFGRDRIRGWDVARRAPAVNPALPIVYMTGGNPDELAIQGVPGSVLLRKPFVPMQLITAVSQLLNAAAFAQ
jgi:CheY-like chemotaxis protein